MNPIGIGLAILGALVAAVGVSKAVGDAENRGAEGERLNAEAAAKSKAERQAEIDAAVSAERKRVLAEQAQARIDAERKQSGAGGVS